MPSGLDQYSDPYIINEWRDIGKTPTNVTDGNNMVIGTSYSNWALKAYTSGDPAATPAPPPTATPGPTATPEPTSTAAPTPDATAVPTPEQTAAPSTEPIETDDPAVTDAPVPTATTAPSPEPVETETPTPEPIETETPSTPAPTAEPKFDVEAVRNDDGTFSFTITRLDKSINDAAVFIGMYTDDDFIIGYGCDDAPGFTEDENQYITPPIPYDPRASKLKIFVWSGTSLEPYTMPLTLNLK